MKNKRKVFVKNGIAAYDNLQISVVTDCGISRLGDLEFDFDSGSCGTFNIKDKPIILLCFSFGWNTRQCRTLQSHNNGSLPAGADFYTSFQTEFIVDSTEDHTGATIANYKGFLLALGGLTNTKLEVFDFSRKLWVQKAGYPFTPKSRTDQYILS